MQPRAFAYGIIVASFLWLLILWPLVGVRPALEVFAILGGIGFVIGECVGW